MLTRIVSNSDHLQAFIDGLKLDLSQPQYQHLLNLADGILVCPEKKTLAAIQRQFVETVDVSNMADFLRISPWDTQEVRDKLRENQIRWLLDKAKKEGKEPTTYINVDDSIGEKDKATTKVEGVSWQYDHQESRKKKPRFKKGFCYLVCTVKIGDDVVTTDLELYVREKVVRHLNRHRPKEKRLRFRTKYRLVRAMLERLRPYLPRKSKVVVQFDSWYASARLIKYCLRQKWQVTCALKQNRTLDGQQIHKIAHQLRHKWYTRIGISTTDEDKTSYFVRRQDGRLAEIPQDVRVFFSKRHPRDKSLSYFMSTDLSCTAKQALQGYSGRWSCEVVNYYAKVLLGLADFRVRSFEAVDRYILIVHLAWAYVEQRFGRECSATIQNYGDVIRQHRDEHAVAWLTEAIDLALETSDRDLVLRRFLRLDQLPA